ncbi:hypothetical protein GCM10023193_29010 [Planotetraspora kaengkrachanensis]|uniref:N-acetyltransferase domain-containing protein n=1 Tax=Planotetraspora kaengkrachanensis TaxID=575193 RepID=A0A8J3PSW1_9ACTN|nr:hypothetical protein Pka01_19030 [Planotetraspora kaengkrachanensis]
MLFRPATEADLDRVVAFTVDEPISWIPADRYLAELAERMYRPEWTWIAEDGDRIVGRALWWGQATSEHPAPWTASTSRPRSPTAPPWRPDCSARACGPSTSRARRSRRSTT